MKVITPPKIVSFQEFASMQFGGMITFRSCICYIYGYFTYPPYSYYSQGRLIMWVRSLVMGGNKQILTI